MPRPVSEATPRELLNGVAVTGLLTAACTFVPLLGMLGAFVLPLPVTYFRVQLGRKAGAIVVAASLVLVAILRGGLTADWLFYGELLVLGFALGESYQAGLSIERSVLLACGAVAGIAIAGLLLYSAAAGSGPSTVVQEYVARNVQITIALYENIGIDPPTFEKIREALEQVEPWLVRLVPAMVVTGSLFVTWVTILLSRPLLVARNLPAPAFGLLSRWKAPETLVWAVIACGLALLIPSGFLKIVGMNVLPVLMTVYFFQGIAIVSYYTEKKRLPRFLRVVIYCLIAVQRLFVLLVIGLGFFDVWLNFRKLESGKNN